MCAAASLRLLLAPAIFALLGLTISVAAADNADNDAAAAPLLSDDALRALISDMRGDDNHLVRIDTTPRNRKRQRNGGCDPLPEALRVIASHPSRADNVTKGLACEYATFCVTDNPTQRSILRGNDEDGSGRYYGPIADLVASEDSYSSAMASQVIYIASFADADNHQGFINAGAVPKLAAVVKRDPKRDSTMTYQQVMWAAAALQNLAATYCDDKKTEGRCTWKWDKKMENLEITQKEKKVKSDGKAARKAMRKDEELIERLIDHACIGPVSGRMTNSNPYPGDNAAIGKHERSANVVAWAAAGALKNLALDQKARPLLERATHCLCRLAYSPDWLEKDKGTAAIHNLRPKNPCWFQDVDHPSNKLCVDSPYVDSDGYTCTDYEQATKKDCKHKGKRGVKANEACCACGGGSPEESWSMFSGNRIPGEL